MSDKVPVALKRAPTVDLTLGDISYKLAFDFRAICQIKAKTGKSLLNGNVWDNIEDDPDLVLTLIWAGLQLHQPELSIEEVSQLLIPSELSLYLATVTEAWFLVKPKEKGAADPKAEPTAGAVSAQ